MELPRGVFVALPALPPMLAKTNKGLNESVKSMKPTQHFVVNFGSMRTPILKVLGGLSLSR
jgi:hypothetical protein